VACASRAVQLTPFDTLTFWHESILAQARYKLGSHAGAVALASRIARNREIAGVHYPSDTAAGRDLAAQLFAALDGVATFKAQLAAATAEWA
jgi:acid phosphatase (class A)